MKKPHKLNKTTLKHLTESDLVSVAGGDGGDSLASLLSPACGNGLTGDGALQQYASIGDGSDDFDWGGDGYPT